MHPFRQRAVRALAALLFVLPVLMGVHSGAAAAAGPTLNGGGSGFAALEIEQWQADTARKPYNLSINYQSQGSSFGRAEFSNGLLDFGATDIVFTSEDSYYPGGLQQDRCGGRPLADCFRYVPVSAGGLGLMYNLTDNSGNRITSLQLTRQQACKIFSGQITRWNDPSLVATNASTVPGLKDMDRPITSVVRADGAGESYVLSEFCIAVDPGDWQAYVNGVKGIQNAANPTPEFLADQPTSTWPQAYPAYPGVPAPPPGSPAAVSGSDGVANDVADGSTGPNSITYDAAGYAKVRAMPTASVQNAAGVFTQPDETNVTVALQYASGRGDGTFNLNFGGPDPRAYYPSTYSYILAQTGGWDPAKGAVLGQFLCYAVGTGQQWAVPLRYAQLSSQIVQISVSAISQIPGAPAASDCVKNAPPPPPPPPVLGGPAAGNAAAGPGGTAGAGGGANGRAALTSAGGATALGGTAAGGSSATTVAGGAGDSGGPGDGEATTSSEPGASGDVTLQEVAAMAAAGPLRQVVEGALICLVGMLGAAALRRRKGST